MKKHNFTYMAAQNFLCFGPDGIEINFIEYGNIVVVLGVNLDNLVLEGSKLTSSNGSGKSSLAEILVYTLYGRTIRQPKKLTHNNLINNKVGKKLRTEVRWGDYRVVRTREPTTLKVWKSSGGDWSKLGDKKWEKKHEISRGKGKIPTQKMLENILGLTYRAFVNVAIFTDNKLGCFLECDAAEKREIVENLFSVDKYKLYAKQANDRRNDCKRLIKDLTNQYDGLLDQLANCKKREKQIEGEESDWIAEKKSEIVSLLKELKAAKEKLESSNEGELISRYQEAQQRIRTLAEEIPDLEGKKANLQEVSTMAQKKLDESRNSRHQTSIDLQNNENNRSECQTEIKKRTLKIENIESGKGTRCNNCFAIVAEENYGQFVQALKNEITHYQSKSVGLEKDTHNITKKLKSFDAGIEKLEAALTIARQKMSEVSNKITSRHEELARLKRIEKPEIDLHHAVLQEQIDNLQERIRAKDKELEGDTPYIKIKETAKQETILKQNDCDNKKIELELAEKDLPYYEFYVTAFGERGIRRFVINGIIPALNSKIAHWMEVLIDGKVKLTFDDELDETIERNPADGEPYVYPQMSGGEKQQLNLALSQGFAHVMVLSSGSCPSLIFLDEVATNIDQRGVVAIYNMILELAKDRQVFVTTHDRDLLEMLNGCEKILLEKKDGFTTIVDR